MAARAIAVASMQNSARRNFDPLAAFILFLICSHMGTKRFDSLIDCWRHGTGACITFLLCGHYKHVSHLVVWYKMTAHVKRDRPLNGFAQSARKCRCTRCGAKDAVITPGDRLQLWRGNR